MKKILVPTDFSPASNKASNYAIDLANSLGAKITFFKAYHPIPYAPEMYDYIGQVEFEALKEQAEKKLIALCNKANKKLKVKSTYKTEEGMAADAILRQTASLKPDLTVMATHGESAVSRSLFGSVTLDVARKIQTPLLVIPENAKYTSFNKILYATDYHDSDIEAIRFLTSLAKKNDAELVVLHVADGEIRKDFEQTYLEEFKKEVSKRTRYSKISYELKYEENVSKAVEKFIKKENVDLVAISKLKRPFFVKLFMPSLTKKMIYHVDIPLLVFNAWDLPSEL